MQKMTSSGVWVLILVACTIGTAKYIGNDNQEVSSHCYDLKNKIHGKSKKLSTFAKTSAVKKFTQTNATSPCPEGYTGLVPHPDDCRLFYYCQPPALPFLYECPDDLYFNPVTDQCDLKQNLPCICHNVNSSSRICSPPASTTSRAVKAA